MIYTKSKDLARLGRAILKEERYQYIKEADIKVGYLITDDEKKAKHKTIYGECVKVSDLYKALTPYDFLIIFYPPGNELDDDQKAILMRHELLHIGVETNGELTITPHDVEDFREIIDQYGLDWAGDAHG